MSTNNSNGNGWRGFWFSVLTAVSTSGIHYFFFRCRQLYFRKNEEDRQKRREEDQQQAEAQRKSEEEDPLLKLTKKDKEIRAYVFSKLGLDQTNTPEGEPVYARPDFDNASPFARMRMRECSVLQ